MNQNILLFGGSFDPLHNGHLHIVREALKQLSGISRVIFVPAFASPGKEHKGMQPEDRLDCLKLGLKDTDYEISNFEIHRKGVSYTVETLHHFQTQFPGAQLCWLLGADAYASFPTWRKPEEIRELATLVAVGRDGQEPELQDDHDIALTIPPSPWSSTALRTSLAAGKIPPGALPKSLEQHLKNLILNGENPYASL